MHELYGIIFTIVSGCFFFIGALLSSFFKKNTKIIHFLIGLTFTLTIGIILFDLIPEASEYFSQLESKYRLLIMTTFIIVGGMILKVIDTFIPHHNHDHSSESEKHLYHIGIVTSLSLICHNVIEGFMIYTTTLTGILEGLLIALGVALHNIPFGMQVSSTLKGGKASKIKVFVLISLLAISGLFGILGIFLLNHTISEQSIATMISVTIGMLIYIAFFELFAEIYRNNYKKVSLLGMLFGVVIVILLFII